MAAEMEALPSRRQGTTVRRGVLREVLRLPLVPAAVLLLVVFAAVFAPVVAPHDPYDQNLVGRLQPPAWEAKGSLEHLLGTDQVGRDLLSRLIYGSRVTVVVVGLTITAAASIGTFLGMVSGFYRGIVDTVLMRLVDIQLALPALLFGVLLAAALKPGLQNVIIIAVLWRWAGYARIIRGQTLSLREREYVQLARVAGAKWHWILLKHILPNVFSTVLVLATLDVATVIVFEASLSFLGLGVVPPTPSWGLMLSEGRNYITFAWWQVTIPGVAIFAVSLSGNLLGDWLRDRLDPRLRQSSGSRSG